jgi:hypothetical protein
MAAEKRPREEMMLQYLNVTRQALYAENLEAERLRSCLSAVEMSPAATDRETDTAEDAAG